MSGMTGVARCAPPPATPKGNDTADRDTRRDGAANIRFWRVGRGSQVATAVLMSLLLAAGFVADAALEQGVASGVLFVGVLALSTRLPGRRSTISLGIAASVLTLLGFFVSPPGGLLWKEVANRLLALLAIWVTAALVLHHKRLILRRDQAAQVRQLRRLSD